MILRKVNPHEISAKAQEALAKLAQALAGARIYARDYELSETRQEQSANAQNSRKFLEQARQSILRASEFDVFGPVDVAHLSAQIDLAKDNLR